VNKKFVLIFTLTLILVHPLTALVPNQSLEQYQNNFPIPQVATPFQTAATIENNPLKVEILPSNQPLIIDPLTPKSKILTDAENSLHDLPSSAKNILESLNLLQL